MLNPIYKKKKQIEYLLQDIQDLYKRNKYSECIKKCEEIANVNSQKNQMVYLHLGRCYMNLGDLQKSKICFLILTEMNPSCDEVFSSLGQICEKTKAFDEAQLYFDVVNSLVDEKYPIKHNEHVFKKSNALFNLAQLQFIKNPEKLDKCKELLMQTLKLNSSHRAAMSLLGEAHLVDKEFDESLMIYQQSFQRNPSSASLCHKIGEVQIQMEQFAESAVSFKKCLTLNQNYLQPYISLGTVLYKHLDKPEQALFNLGEYLSRSKLIKDKSHEYNESQVSVRLLVGDIYENLFKSKEAIAVYEEASNYNSNSIEPLLRIAAIYFEKRQKYKKASLAYEKIIKISPRNKLVFLRLGQCHFHLNQFNKAIQVLMNQLLFDPYNSETFSLIAQCYAKINDFKQADIYFRLSLQINPYDKDVLAAREQIIKNIPETNYENFHSQE